MTTIPKEERPAATAALNEVKGWLGAADFATIATELDNCTAATVRAVAKGERFTLDIYDKLLTLGRAKRSNFRSTLEADERTTSNQGRTKPEPRSTVKTPENDPAQLTVPFPAKPATKPRTKAVKVPTDVDPHTMDVLNNMAAEGAAELLPDKAPTRRRKVVEPAGNA